MEVFYESIHLRKLVLISVRIDDINNNELSEMLMSGRSLCHQAYGVFQLLHHIYKTSKHKFGFGLGINTMEGRKQKHQQITIY